MGKSAIGRTGKGEAAKPFYESPSPSSWKGFIAPAEPVLREVSAMFSKTLYRQDGRPPRWMMACSLAVVLMLISAVSLLLFSNSSVESTDTVTITSVETADISTSSSEEAADTVDGEELETPALEKARSFIPEAAAIEENPQWAVLGKGFSIMSGSGEELGYIDIDAATGDLYTFQSWTATSSSEVNLGLEEAVAIAEDILTREGVDLSLFYMIPNANDGYLHNIWGTDEYIYEIAFLPVEDSFEGRGDSGCIVRMSPKDGGVLNLSIWSGIIVEPVGPDSSIF
jgi:hypothetical protein